jgi:putative sterol carrier protein
VTAFVGIGQHAGQTRGVIRYLSLEWLDALTAEAATDPEVQAAAQQHTLGVTQIVTDGPEGTVIYHFQSADGRVEFGPGAAHPEDVHMEQTFDTATEVATGRLNAQEAFIKGRIRFTGDAPRMMEALPLFGALDAVFRRVAERTEYR